MLSYSSSSSFRHFDIERKRKITFHSFLQNTKIDAMSPKREVFMERRMEEKNKIY